MAGATDMSPTAELRAKLGDMTIEQAGGKDKDEFIKSLESLDKTYSSKQKELNRAIADLQKKMAPAFQTLEDRRALIVKANEDSAPGFWREVLTGCDSMSDQIEEWDIELLDCVTDIRSEYLDDNDHLAGFKLTFHFKENAFIENTKLTTSYRAERVHEWTDDIELVKLTCTDLRWKEGKNITVHQVEKQKKTKGRKGKKILTMVEERRNSIFRFFFRTIEPDMELSDEDEESDDDGDKYSDEESDEDDEFSKTEMIMQDVHDIALDLRDTVIPHAVRFYTGEAGGDDEDESGSEDDSNFDDSDGEVPELTNEQQEAVNASKEECKQQ